MSVRTIAGLAREGGVGVETIRFYQRRGLIPTPDRWSRDGVGAGIRRYGEEDVRRLKFIRSAHMTTTTIFPPASIRSTNAWAGLAVVNITFFPDFASLKIRSS